MHKNSTDCKRIGADVADFGPDHPFTGAPILCSYTRAQAIEDGVLADVSQIAGRMGWKHPVAFTVGVWSALVAFDGDELEIATDLRLARVREVLHIAATVISLQKTPTDTVRFAVTRTDRKTIALWAKCGPGDEGGPVVTVMLQGED